MSTGELRHQIAILFLIFCFLMATPVFAAETEEKKSEEAPAVAPPTTGALGEPLRPVVIYSQKNAPSTPKIEELEQKDSIGRHGITWTFDKKVPAGRFVNGDWYVVGPVTVTKIDPGWDGTKNGSVLNVPPRPFQTGFDSRVLNRRYKAELTAKTPIALKPGDALVSSIGFEKIKSDRPVKSFAVLTCLKEPAPPDAFRPGFCDREQVICLSRDLKRDLLPRLPLVPKAPDIKKSAALYERPWVDLTMYEGDQAEYQRGGYGRAVCEEGARATLLLESDFKPEEKEPLLIGFIQYGLDLWGAVKSGHSGWFAHGGWGSGRKWPIVFAGLLLGDDKMACVNKTYPKVSFQEDQQVGYDDSWTGAGVCYLGHMGPQGSKKARGWGAFENVHPSRWPAFIGSSYRVNMTSSTWAGLALAIRILNAEKEWNQDAFLDYCDRWMYEPDPGFGTGDQYQQETWDPLAGKMWSAYRENLPKIPGRDCPPRPHNGWIKEREMKSVAVTVDKNRAFQVDGKPFFPLLVFAEHPKRIPDVLAIGANTVVEGSFESSDDKDWLYNAHVNNRLFLDELAKNNLYGVFGADMRVAGHPALLGWIHLDEPDKVLSVPPTQTERSKVVRNYGLMTWARLPGKKSHEEWKALKKAQDDDGDALQLMACPFEWMKKVDKSRPVFLTLGPAFFKALKEGGNKEFCQGCPANCDVIGCKAPDGNLAEAVAKLREIAPDKPVVAWIETKGVAPQELGNQVRAAISKGATAIGYQGFEGFGDEKRDAAVMQELKRLNALIIAHADALFADPAKADALLK